MVLAAKHATPTIQPQCGKKFLAALAATRSYLESYSQRTSGLKTANNAIRDNKIPINSENKAKSLITRLSWNMN